MTDQQKQFAIEYVKTGNMTQAAVNAGYSEASAYNQGSRLMKNDEVVRYVEELQSERAQELRAHMASEASSAFKVMTDIMHNPNAKDADRLKAAIEVMDRTGYVSENKVSLDTNMVFTFEAFNDNG